MNIWFVNQYAIPPSQAGITRHYDFAQGLVERGHKVTIIASSFDHVTRKETRLQAGEKHRLEVNDGVPFLWLRTPPYSGNGLARIKNMLSFSFDLWIGRSTQKLSKPDVIVGSSPHLFAALSALGLARRLGVPFVLEVRDLWPQSLIDLAGYSRRHPLVVVLEAIERFLYRNAQQIVSLLPQAGDHIAKKGGKADDIHWIPNGISLSRIPNKLVDKHSSPFTFMYAGSHGLINSLDTLIQAAYILQTQHGGIPIKIRLVGDGPEKVGLMQKAVQLGLNNIQFENPVPKQEIYTRLLEADAFVLNMKDKGLYKNGISVNKLYDFMACGRPVVFGADVSNDPIAKADAGITVLPDHPTELAEAMVKIAQTPLNVRQEMGNRGRQYALQNHDLSSLAERYERVLRQAVSYDLRFHKRQV